jgi:hypothetical protein
MPRVRLNGDGTAVPASPAIGEDGETNLVFGVGAGSTVKVTIDATAWANVNNLTASVWFLPDGGTLAETSLSGKTATAFVVVPDDGNLPWRRGYRVQNTLTGTPPGSLSGTDNIVTRTTVWLRAEGR